MRAESSRGNLAGKNRIADGREILERRVATGEQCRLTLVKLRIGKANVGADHGDQRIATAVGNIAESGFHGLWIAGRIEYHVEEFPSGERSQLVRSVAIQRNEVIGGQR